MLGSRELDDYIILSCSAAKSVCSLYIFLESEILLYRYEYFVNN